MLATLARLTAALLLAVPATAQVTAVGPFQGAFGEGFEDRLTAMLDGPALVVWWTITVAEIVNCLGFVGYYRRGRWLSHRV